MFSSKLDRKRFYVALLRDKKSSDEEILEAVAYMLETRCTMKEITICITAVRRTGCWEKACECLEYIKNRGKTPNVIVYSALIAACESSGSGKKQLVI